MRSLFAKKVSVLGRPVSVFVMVIVGVAALATAGLIPYFGTILGEVSVTQGLYLDDALYNDPVVEVFEPFTSLEDAVRSSSHQLENKAGANAYFLLANSCDTANPDNDCVGVSTSIEYPLSASGALGTEDRIVVSADEAGVVTLGDFDSLEWYVMDGRGYAPHVDVILDLDGDGESDDALVFEYAKVDPNDCDDSADYPTGNYDTFNDKGIVDGEAYAWLSSGPAGPCGDATFDSMHNSLNEWKAGIYAGISANTSVLRFEIEVDNWITNSNATVMNIDADGGVVSASFLEPNETLDFTLVHDFEKMLRPDVYTMTTEVSA